MFSLKQFHKAIANIWFNFHMLETNQSNISLYPSTLHQFTILLSGISVSFSPLARSGNKLHITSSIY